jgi:hypothetical protein
VVYYNQKGEVKMYIILLSNRMWYTADTLQEVKDFIKIVKKAKILKCIAPGQWEEIKIKGE